MVFLRCAHVLHSVVEDNVHEGIVASEHTGDASITVQLKRESLVHIAIIIVIQWIAVSDDEECADGMGAYRFNSGVGAFGMVCARNRSTKKAVNGTGGYGQWITR